MKIIYSCPFTSFIESSALSQYNKKDDNAFANNKNIVYGSRLKNSSMKHTLHMRDFRNVANQNYNTNEVSNIKPREKKIIRMY